MTLKVKGLHHFTAISGDPTENAKFYVNKLGLRMVKKTVNHDAPEYYHLFYGDKKGTPGSSITFFPNMADQKGKTGAGMISELGLRIPEESISYWEERLNELEIEFEEEKWQGKKTLKFEDGDGLQLRLAPQKTKDFETWEDSPVPEEHQIRGMHHVKFSLSSVENTLRLLKEMNFEEINTEDENLYLEAEDGSGVEIEQTNQRGRMGRGTVHHIAFKVENEEEQEKWRDKLQRMGMRPTPLISRKYFTSFYFRTPGGILFEFSSMGPGYTADESVEELGSSLVLPEKLQERREEIEKSLPEFKTDDIIQ